MNYSIDGYRNNSPDRFQNSNTIPGNLISMQNVSQKLRLIPIVNGQPDYNRARLAEPNQPDIQFEQDVEAVLELPYSQSGGYLNPQTFQGIFNPTQGMNFQNPPNSYAENAMTAFQNPYVNQQNQTNLVNSNLPNPASNELQPIQMRQADIQLPSIQDSVAPAINNLQTNYNALQQQEAQQTQANQAKRNNPFGGQSNIYGGFNLSNTAFMLGRSIQDKNILGTVASAGKLLLEGTRNALSGAGLRKVEMEAVREREEELERSERNQGWRFLQKGGAIGKILTGNFIEGDKNNIDQKTAEIERGEYVQTPDGNTMETLGDRHSEGGELVNLPGGTKVVSDYLKIGTELASFFKKEHNLNVKSGSTFSTVLDKYKQKIGLDRLIDEEASLMQKVADQEKVEFQGTRDINLQVLSEKVQEIQPQKLELEDRFNTFTNLVYDKQEQTKQPGESNFEKQEGGEVQQDPTAPPVGNTDEQILPEQQPQTEGSQIEQMILQYAQITGAQPEELIQQLQQLDETQLQEAVTQIMQVVQQSKAQTEVEETPQPDQPIVDEKPQEEFQRGGMTPTQFAEFITDYSVEPTYSYGDLPSQRTALEPLLQRAGIQLENGALTTQQSQDQYAGQYQQYLRDNYTGLTNHYSAQVAPTQQGLQVALNNGLVTELQLKDLGVKVQNGSVLRGSKGIVPKSNEQKVSELITKAGQNNSEGYKKYVDSNFVDNRWYYRTPNLETIDFESEQARDKYLKDGSYEEIEDKDGRKIYYSGKQGLYFDTTVVTPAEVKNDPSATPTTPNNTLNRPNFRGNSTQSSAPLLPPDQSNLPPTYQTTSLRSIGSVQANPLSISPEATIRELNRQYTTASNLASETNPYTAGALTANLQAQTNDAINQAYTQANMANAQDRRNVENINEERIQQRDLTNTQYLGQFEKEQILGQQNLNNELRSYFDNRNRQNVVNWNLQNQANSYNALLQHYQISGNGIQNTGEPVYLTVPGVGQIPNPNYNKVQETITKTTPDGRTTTVNKTKTVPPKKQKGGKLSSTELKKWLK